MAFAGCKESSWTHCIRTAQGLSMRKAPRSGLFRIRSFDEHEMPSRSCATAVHRDHTKGVRVE